MPRAREASANGTLIHYTAKGEHGINVIKIFHSVMLDCVKFYCF